MILKCIKTVATVAFAMVSINVAGQDLLARQAPIDRKLKAVDSLALVRQIKAEQAVYPAYSLYPTWENQRVHAYGNTVSVPDTFRIDLSGFCMPTTHTKITSKCGPRWRRMHNGLDIKVYIGDTIRAAFDGRVRMVKYERRGYGKYVVIRHDNGLETIYGHLSKQIVAENEYVKDGDPIGLGGNTGRSTGSHLHFETRFLGEVINPEFMFDFPNQDIVADSYLFIKGANRYAYQRTRALAAVKSGKMDQVVAKQQASEGNSSVRYHKIKKGDTLGRISRIYHVSIDRLCQLNGIKRTTILRPGQVLKCS
ncbi:peptidoglycan DD-metalloendopeptidase family protein [Phocaeicola coprophilus]|uniref:peptidoglycan DD-metalloendopeptidase family protein n=1 Tax=Phocaeicola coprophilus TaxID=387090 RepID=UPI0039921CBF